ncbi:hypothetical protein SASPL_140989 [Salvia splendens]|uniref:Nudix hydrolase domain-containing protein n=1 Tax=Salvia splendens TaxID=180675 RepID=A0A8X8ZCF6_SALSN|nr:hypothetical protein SASPL_140989 [Salvia splendens]
MSAGLYEEDQFLSIVRWPVPDGEEKPRAICTPCRNIAYENPKMVVGCLIEHDNKILLCKRNIQPSHGLWTLPAGYMEIGESAAEQARPWGGRAVPPPRAPKTLGPPKSKYIHETGPAAEGAIRETWEEANAQVEILSPFAQLDIPLIGQNGVGHPLFGRVLCYLSALFAFMTYVIFLAKLKRPHFAPGPESSECMLFALEDIPFDSLAFSSMLVTLNLYKEDKKTGRPKFHYGIINKRPGTSPSEIREYTLDSHMRC